MYTVGVGGLGLEQYHHEDLYWLIKPKSRTMWAGQSCNKKVAMAIGDVTWWWWSSTCIVKSFTDWKGPCPMLVTLTCRRFSHK